MKKKFKNYRINGDAKLKLIEEQKKRLWVRVMMWSKEGKDVMINDPESDWEEVAYKAGVIKAALEAKEDWNGNDIKFNLYTDTAKEQFNIKIYKPTRWEENTAILEFTDLKDFWGETEKFYFEGSARNNLYVFPIMISRNKDKIEALPQINDLIHYAITAEECTAIVKVSTDSGAKTQEGVDGNSNIPLGGSINPKGAVEYHNSPAIPVKDWTFDNDSSWPYKPGSVRNYGCVLTTAVNAGNAYLYKMHLQKLAENPNCEEDPNCEENFEAKAVLDYNKIGDYMTETVTNYHPENKTADRVDRYADRGAIINGVTGKTTVSVSGEITGDIAKEIKKLAKLPDKYVMIEGRYKDTHSFNINGIDPLTGKLKIFQTSSDIGTQSYSIDQLGYILAYEIDTAIEEED